MAYIDKIQKIMDILNDDTFRNINSTENSYFFTKALTDMIDVSKKLVVAELTILQLKSRINHKIIRDWNLFQSLFLTIFEVFLDIYK